MPRSKAAERPRAAVVGSGVAGLTAAYLLQRAYDVTLYEADDRLGGHAHSHDIAAGDGRLVTLDTGFIVHNAHAYPSLLRLFGELGVGTRDSDMSMSVRCEGCGLEYAGSRGPRGLFPAGGSVARPEYLAMLAAIPAFYADARRLLRRARPGRADLRRVPGAGTVPALFHQPLRGSAGGGGVVVPAGRRAELPGAVPVRVPRPPRDALGRQVGRVAHGGGGIAGLRRPDRQAADLRPLLASRSGPSGGSRAAWRSVPATTSPAGSPGWWWPPIRIRPCGCWIRPPARSGRFSAPSATAAARSSCTPTRGCCRGHPPPAPPGTTCCPAARGRPGRSRSAIT